MTETLILSPHIDDEVLGCFSFLSAGTVVLYGGVESRPTMPRSLRIREAESSAAALGFAFQLLDNEVNHYRSEDLITPFETAINNLAPRTVLLPVPSYNQDHRAFNEAARVATRPHDSNWRVPRVLAFEQPHSAIWPQVTLDHPGYFRRIDIDRKLEAYARYASQVRGHRSPDTVAALAALRGAVIGEAHAEAFHVLRWIDGVT